MPLITLRQIPKGPTMGGLLKFGPCIYQNNLALAIACGLASVIFFLLVLHKRNRQYK